MFSEVIPLIMCDAAPGGPSSPVAQGGMGVIEFECRGHRFGLPLACVQRVVASAQPAPLPGAAAIVLGVLNVAGETVTVLDFARRAGCAPGPILPSQQMLIVQMKGWLAGLVVDRVLGIAERDGQRTPVPSARVGVAEFIDSIVRLDDGLCLIIDPEKFLFDEEERSLLAALGEAADEH